MNRSSLPLALALAVSLCAASRAGGRSDNPTTLGRVPSDAASGGQQNGGGGSRIVSGVDDPRLDPASAGSSSGKAKSAPAKGLAGGCPVFSGYSRLVSPITGDYFGAGKGTIDPTRFDSVFGSRPNSPQRYTWPGIPGDLVRFTLPTDNYVSLQFTVTPAALAKSQIPGHPPYGRYTEGEDGIRPLMSLTISRQCGDFGQGGSVVGGCLANKVHADGGITWMAAGKDQPGICVLSPGEYYLNIINADIAAMASGGQPVSTIPHCLQMRGSKASVYPDICNTVELDNWGSFVTPQAPGGSGSGSGDSGGTGASAGQPANNALACDGDRLTAAHVDFFSPMPPSCSSQGLAAGQPCTDGQQCPLP
jgi:hypothetical protein